MISEGFYFSSKIEKNKGDRDLKQIVQILEVPLLPDPVILILFINPATRPNAEKVLRNNVFFI